MKLNIEELAREADLSAMTADAHCREDYWTATRTELEAFARLIVERCAQECDKLKLQLFDSSKSPPGMDQMRKNCGMGASMCATDIRNLMGD